MDVAFYNGLIKCCLKGWQEHKLSDVVNVVLSKGLNLVAIRAL